MSKGLKIVAGVLGSLVLVSAISFSTIWSQRNTAVTLEEKITAQYSANQSSYDNMWKRFKEITQVTELQTQQFKEVYMGLIQGRYQDSNLLFKMVKEQNPQMDTTVYSQLQREIVAGRLEFNNEQKTMVDVVREYNTLVRKDVIMAAITGRQVKDPNQYIVTSDKTQDAFKNKKDDVINLTK